MNGQWTTDFRVHTHTQIADVLEYTARVALMIFCTISLRASALRCYSFSVRSYDCIVRKLIIQTSLYTHHSAWFQSWVHFAFSSDCVFHTRNCLSFSVQSHICASVISVEQPLITMHIRYLCNIREEMWGFRLVSIRFFSSPPLNTRENRTRTSIHIALKLHWIWL